MGVLDLNGEGAERVAQVIRDAGGEALSLQASIADRRQVEAAVAELRGALGPISILVNNAAIVDFTPFEEITDDKLDDEATT